MKFRLLICILFIASIGNAQSYVEKPISILDAQIVYLNSATNLTGKTRETIPIRLPANTIKWYYTFSAYREARDIQQVQSTFNLFSKLSYVIDQSGTTSNAIQLLGQPPGGNYCDVYLLGSPSDVQHFESKDDNWGGTFNYYREGSRLNFVSGVVEIMRPNKGIQYLGIRNRDLTYGISVQLQVVAIVGEEASVNGWTKEQKDKLYSSLKRSLRKGVLARVLNSDELNSFIVCSLKKLTSEYTFQQVASWANYEFEEVLKKQMKDCDQELNLKLGERTK